MKLIWNTCIHQFYHLNDLAKDYSLSFKQYHKFTFLGIGASMTHPSECHNDTSELIEFFLFGRFEMVGKKGDQRKTTIRSLQVRPRYEKQGLQRVKLDICIFPCLSASRYNVLWLFSSLFWVFVCTYWLFLFFFMLSILYSNYLRSNTTIFGKAYFLIFLSVSTRQHPNHFLCHCGNFKMYPFWTGVIVATLRVIVASGVATMAQKTHFFF